MLFDVSLLEMTALLKAYPKVDQYGERWQLCLDNNDIVTIQFYILC
jgi:hypothetical protein